MRMNFFRALKRLLTVFWLAKLTWKSRTGIEYRRPGQSMSSWAAGSSRHSEGSRRANAFAEAPACTYRWFSLRISHTTGATHNQPDLWTQSMANDQEKFLWRAHRAFLTLTVRTTRAKAKNVNLRSSKAFHDSVYAFVSRMKVVCSTCSTLHLFSSGILGHHWFSCAILRASV